MLTPWQIGWIMNLEGIWLEETYIPKPYEFEVRQGYESRCQLICHAIPRIDY